MRLLLIFHRFGPYHIARLTGARGVTQNVVGLELSGADKTYAWDILEYDEGLSIRTVFPDQDSDELSYKSVKEKVWGCLDDIKPDVVAVPGWSKNGALAALMWCLTNRVPAVLLSESTYLDHQRQLIKEAVKRSIVSLFSSALVGGGLHVKYLQTLGMPEDVISFGYNIVDNQYFANGAAEARASDNLRLELDLPEKYFLVCARFICEKNLPDLLVAYDQYWQACRGDAWSLVLVGDGELKQKLEAKAKSVEAREHVYFAGFRQIEELPSYYGLASAFILPSQVEPWGLVVNEAMAAGLPVLVSDRCGSAELVVDGENGFRFSPDSIDGMADAMARLTHLTKDQYDSYCRSSERRISNWGPDKFGLGIKEAAEKALEVGPKKKKLLSWFAVKVAAMRS